MLKSASAYVGTSRNNNRAQITEFLRIFGLPFEDADRKPVPFCAAGVVYAAIEAYCMIDPSIKSDRPGVSDSIQRP